MDGRPRSVHNERVRVGVRLLVGLLPLLGCGDSASRGGAADGPFDGPVLDLARDRGAADIGPDVQADAQPDVQLDAPPGDLTPDSPPTCDPDGSWILGSPIAYACCFENVNIDVSTFVFVSDGAEILAIPMGPGCTMMGAATTCDGTFDGTCTLTGTCNETYRLVGSFTSNDEWTGTFSVQFSGPDCNCLDLDPCGDESFPATATRL